jgi:hypothetical protein
VGKLREEIQRLEEVKRANMQQLALFTANTGILTHIIQVTLAAVWGS